MAKMLLNDIPPISLSTAKNLESIQDCDINFSDIPETKAEDLRAIAKQARENRKKKQFTLRLDVATIDWWKNTFGDGYTGVMAEFLSNAKNNTEIIKQCL